MFFSDVENVYHPIASIESFTTGYDDSNRKFMWVRLVDRTNPVKVAGRSVDLVERAGSTVIPAMPGTQCLLHLDNNEVWFEPVIAWIVTIGDEPVPVTPAGSNGGVTNVSAVVHPNGSVSAFEEVHADVDDYLTSKGFTVPQIKAALNLFDQTKG